MTNKPIDQKNYDATGHRQRVKDKFIDNYNKNYNISEEDLLEMLLFFAIPRKDVKPLAKNLLKNFDNFAELLNAPEEELQSLGIGENTCLLFKIITLSYKQLLQKKIINKPILSNSTHIKDYLYLDLAYEKIEYIKILYLNAKYELIKSEIIQEGTINYSAIYPREIVRKALNIGAMGFILAHNHPSSSLIPSNEDIKITNHLYTITKPLNLILHDHYIISSEGMISFKELGFL